MVMYHTGDMWHGDVTLGTHWRLSRTSRPLPDFPLKYKVEASVMVSD